MRIADVEQETTDFDWFAVDEQGSIAHFATAGFKGLPASVAAFAEDLTIATDYFVNHAPVISGHRINQDIGRDRDDWKGEARYLRSFVEMAEKGLYFVRHRNVRQSGNRLLLCRHPYPPYLDRRPTGNRPRHSWAHCTEARVAGNDSTHRVRNHLALLNPPSTMALRFPITAVKRD
jgi:hypothetical protein